MASTTSCSGCCSGSCSSETSHEKAAEARYPGMRSVADGSGAVVWVESHIAQGACAYPITPSTPMGEGFAAEFANGRRNLWEEPLRFLEPESEHSSASACEGFALAGGRVANFTSGQGLILMKEVLYVIAGKRLPVVFHVGARALTSQSLNIHCGHDDVMGVADCGWGMLFARNAQEAADLALISRRVAEEAETPFFCVQDGFLTTHTLETLHLPEPELMRDFIGRPQDRLRKLFDPQQPLLSGPVQNQDSYMKGKVAQRHFYDRVAPALAEAMKEYGELTGRRYPAVRSYRMEDAQFALVGLGSMMETAETAVDWLRTRHMRVGAVSLTSFRPFPSQELVEVLMDCEGICVIERLDVPLAQSNPLAVEIKAALSDMLAGFRGSLMDMPRVHSAVAGLGGRDIRPAHLIAAARNLAKPGGLAFFAMGVDHDAGLEIPADPDVRPAHSFSLRGHSVGGFGSVTTNKVLATVASELFGMHVQAFSKYGSEKKGLPTSYFLTLAPAPIRLHAELNTVEFVAIQDPNAFLYTDPLQGLRPGGILLLQSELPSDAVWKSLPARARRKIREQNLKVFALDGRRIAHESASRPDLQLRMQGIALLGAFLRLAPFREQTGWSEEALFEALKKPLTKYFGKRGEQVVAANLAAARRGYNELREVKPLAASEETKVPNAEETWQEPVLPSQGVVQSDFCTRVVDAYKRGQENHLEADEFVARSLMPPCTAGQRSFRNLAPEIPVLIASACVGCMECVNACPDTAILAKVAEPQVLDERLGKVERGDLREYLREQFAVTLKYHDLAERRGEKGGLFGIFVDQDKCKGCGECVVVCGTHNALKMVPKGDVEMTRYDLGMDLYRHLPETPARFLNEKSLGDVMLAGCSLLYSGGAGSCMGCGEGTAIRQMLAATGFVYGRDQMGIVAATGCNTVFGSTYPYNPFAVPWTSSLFENAPADAMGIRMRWDQEGHSRRRLWVIGGDGAMYDIGFQSLSRMVMSGMDIKVLVLDTQVYSNTGGQSSTATFTGQDAKMAAYGTEQHGKRERRKDLAQILMMHPGVFVAQTTPAHVNHFYKAVMAANEFPGPAVVICYAACPPEHGIADDHASLQAKLAVESRAFPLLIYDPRTGERFRERLNLRGNPAMKQDWYDDPGTGKALDFIQFARTEGRFGRHFDAQGQPDPALMLAQQDRLENWRSLQELAGLR
ncbi:MAG: 2-oxoacid:acceptor oxidoreductase family protein [Terriglobales bacterium]